MTASPSIPFYKNRRIIEPKDSFDGNGQVIIEMDRRAMKAELSRLSNPPEPAVFGERLREKLVAVLEEAKVTPRYTKVYDNNTWMSPTVSLQIAVAETDFKKALNVIGSIVRASRSELAKV